MTKQTTAVQKHETTTAIQKAATDNWGASELDATDILIPKVLLMQPMSDLVANDKAKVGDLVKSTTKEILGSKDKPFEFIPIKAFKTWILEEKVGEKFEFRGVEPMTASNKDGDKEWTENGASWRRNRCLNFYALLPIDIAREENALKIAANGDMPDPDDALLPIVITFQRSGYMTGKELVTHFAKAARFGVPPAVRTFKMKSAMEKNDKGTYYVPMIEMSDKTPAEYLPVCQRWYETLTQSTVKVDQETGEVL